MYHFITFNTGRIKTIYIRIFTLAIATLSLWSCSTPPKAEKAVAAKPENSLQIASLNLANFNKRIERKNIVEFVKTLKLEEVELLGVQGISRYPGVSTRVDFVNELTSQTDWRNVFGEMENISGRQTGNAIFSSYPILSHYNQTFEKVKSANFEAALEATIDAGVTSLFVISTQLPSKAPLGDQKRCMEIIASLSPADSNPYTIITGNLPVIGTVQKDSSFIEISNPEQAKKSAPALWYSENASFKLLSSRIVETELGTIVIAQISLFRQK